MDTTQNTKTANTRTLVVAIFFMCFVLGILYKLFSLYMLRDEYAKMAEDMVIKKFTVEPKRGNLYSDDGSLLATSITQFDVHFDTALGSDAHFEKWVKPLSDSLYAMFGRNHRYSRYFSVQALRKSRKQNNKYHPIGFNLRYSELARLRRFPLLRQESRLRMGGIVVEQETSRKYPLGNIAGRSVGYVRKDELGHYTRVGLEGAFDNYLAGVEGHRMKQKIAKGQWKPISVGNEVEPEDGSDVVSTINTNIQDIAHHALLTQLEKYQADHGCVVVMEVNTGEIKAISNLGRTQSGKYSELLNYAIGETYEPGSVFKTMSMVVALEEAKIDTTYQVDTKNGVISFYGKPVRDSNRRGYGKISVARALEVSSNTGIVQMVHDLFHKNPKKFISKLDKMHLTQKLGLPILGEGTPKIPRPGQKNWSGIALEWMAFGYGLEMTPLQVLTFYNSIANNGTMVQPRMIKEIRKWNKTQEKFDVKIVNKNICSEQTASKIKKMLENAVKNGTGKKLYAADFPIAGKTGTAQKDYKNKSKLNYISSFAGFFPAQAPKYSCIVVIHNPDKAIGYYGADVSGPVFKSIARKIYTNSLLIDTIEDIEKPSQAVQKSYDKYFDISNRYKTIVPNVVGMCQMDAVSILENLGLNVTTSGTGIVREQSLPSGQKIGNNKNITLQLL